MSAPVNGYVVWDYWNHQMMGPYRSWALADAQLQALRARGCPPDWSGIEAVTIELPVQVGS